ncbi:MAG: glycosyltransferase, partial [Planctomycetota bacterium]|nr:glycosyltransferase [Planctomycetota bacterium]
MRILHIITRLILGGAQENTVLSCIGQQARGHRVRLLVGPTAGPEGSLVAEARASGVELLEIPFLLRQISPWHDLRAFLALRQEIRRYQPDVVHTHSSKAGVLGRWAAWQENRCRGAQPAAPRADQGKNAAPIFIIHTIHGLPFHPYQSALANFFYRAAEKWAAQRCHCLVSVANAMTAQAVAAGVAPQEKFATVYSGMRIEPFLRADYDVVALRQRWGLSPSDIVIGKVARLFELKGHEFLLPAFAALAASQPRLRLLLVGDGLWRNRLENLAQNLGIRERVVFAGLV